MKALFSLLFIIPVLSFGQPIKTPMQWDRGVFKNWFAPPEGDTVTPPDVTKRWVLYKAPILYVWNGAKWDAASSGSVGSIVISDTSYLNPNDFYGAGTLLNQIGIIRYTNAEIDAMIAGAVSNVSNPGVTSFGSPQRTGDIIPQFSDYSAFYQPLGNQDLPLSTDTSFSDATDDSLASQKAIHDFVINHLKYISSGSESGKFGIGDNTSLVNRSIAMGNNSFYMTGASAVSFHSQQSGFYFDPSQSQFKGVQNYLSFHDNSAELVYENPTSYSGGFYSGSSNASITESKIAVYQNIGNPALDNLFRFRYHKVLDDEDNSEDADLYVPYSAGTKYIPLSVNDIFPGPDGNIDLSGNGGGTTGGGGSSNVGTITFLGETFDINGGNNVTLSSPTLQQVTDAGHTTTQGIIVFDNNLGTVGSYTGRQALFTAQGDLQIQNVDGWTGIVRSESLTGHRLYQLQDKDGIIPVVNPELEFSDNADAIANGLIPGTLYRTGDVLKIVH